MVEVRVLKEIYPFGPILWTLDIASLYFIVDLRINETLQIPTGSSSG